MAYNGKTNWQHNDTVTEKDMNRIEQGIKENADAVDALNEPGAITDTKIGNRTINDATAASSDTGSITTLLGRMANMTKAITGGATWRTAPVKSLSQLNNEKAPLASPTFTGTPSVPTAAADTITTQAASTAFVMGQASTAVPSRDNGLGAAGSASRWARADHQHPAVYADDYATATTLPGAYPRGQSVFFVTSTAGGWPSAQGTVQTIKGNSTSAVVQYFYPSDAAGQASVRFAGSDANVWGAWGNVLDSRNHNSTGDPHGQYVKKSGDTVTGNLTLEGGTTFSGRPSFNATGGAPFQVASSSAVTNLNADLLDGQQGTFYQNASNLTSGTVAAARLPAATSGSQGAMTASDKAKLDGIAAGANNYTHPSSHPASIITQDASNRFVTDAEKSAWNAKETPAGAQTKMDAAITAHVAATNPHTQYARGTELAALQAEVNDLAAQQGEAAAITHSIVQGQTIVEAQQTSAASVVVEGRTLHNIYRYGDFEQESGSSGVAVGWVGSALKGAIPSLVTEGAKYGIKAQRITSTDNSGTSNPTDRYLQGPMDWEVGKYYLVLVDATTDGISTAGLRVVHSNPVVAVPEMATVTSRTLYVKFSPTTQGSVNQVRIENRNQPTTTGWVQYDGLRIFELSATDYAKVGVDPGWTGEELAAKFPYIDGMQSVRDPAIIIKGRNHAPWMENSYNEGSGLTTFPNAWENNRLKVQNGSSDTHGRGIWVDVIAGRQYTLSFKHERATQSGRVLIGYTGTDAGVMDQAFVTGDRIFTFTPLQNRILIRFVTAGTNAAGVANPSYFWDIMLVLGDSRALPPSFVAKEDQTHVADVTLSSLPSGLRDRYEADRGKVRRTLGEVLFSGLTYAWIVPGTNADRISYNRPANMAATVGGGQLLVEGMAEASGSWDQAVNIGKYSTMQGGTIIDFVVAKGTTRTQFEVAISMSAKLVYRLATPYWEDVQHQGTLTLHPGSNIVKVVTGRVLREKVNPIYYAANSNYQLNRADLQASWFSKRVDEILQIYKGASIDNTWAIATASNSYGNQRAACSEANYDSNADYYVDYIVLDQHTYTTSITEASITIAVNLGSVVGNTVDRLAQEKRRNDEQDWAIDYEAAHLENTRRDLDSLKKEMDQIILPLSQGVNLLESNQSSTMETVLHGQTRYNLLGTDGGCEGLAPYTLTGADVTLSMTIKRSGQNSIRCQPTSNRTSYLYKDYTYPLDPTKQYLFAAWVYIESYTSGSLSITVRDYGNNTQRYVAPINLSTVGKWQLAYVKIPTGHTIVGNGFRILFGSTTSGDLAVYFDEIRLIELSAAEYAAINPSGAGDEVDRLIPYIDGMQSVRGVSITVKGRNIAKGTPDTIHANAVLNAPYDLTLNATGANNNSFFDVDVIPGRTYAYRVTATGPALFSIFRVLNTSGAIGAVIAGGLTPASFVVPADISKVRIYLSSTGAGAITFRDWMLALGSVDALPPSFVPNEDQRHTADVTLHKVGISTDFYDASRGKKWAAIGERLLGGLTYLTTVTGTNADRIVYGRPTGTREVAGQGVMLVEGMAEASGAWDLAANIGKYSTTQGAAIIDFIVTKGMTRAQFEASANLSAKVLYRHATPAWEDVPHSGALTVHPGSNIVDVVTGRVLREKVVPKLDAGNYYIQSADGSSYWGTSRTKFTTRQYLRIYNGAQADDRWSIVDGRSFASANSSRFEAGEVEAAEWYVDYAVLDDHAYTTAIAEASVTIAANLGTAVRQHSEEIARIKAHNDVQDFALDYIQAHTDNNTVDIAALTPRVTAQESISANRDGYGTTAGTGTAYTLSLSPAPTLTAGLRVTVRLHADNGATPTINVNALGAKSIRKPNGNAPAVGLLKANSVYTLVYDGSVFILQGEGGEYGDAIAADVLAGKTIGTETGLVAGTMVDRGAPIITPGPASQSIQAGRYTGGTVQGSSELIATNIRDGKSIFGVTGTLRPLLRYRASTHTILGHGLLAYLPYEFDLTGLPFQPEFVSLVYSGMIAVNNTTAGGGDNSATLTASVVSGWQGNGVTRIHVYWDVYSSLYLSMTILTPTSVRLRITGSASNSGGQTQLGGTLSAMFLG